MAEQPVRGKWFGVAEFCIFAALFVWLRWFSSLWQFRWTGFLFGVVFVLSSLWNPGKSRPWRDRLALYRSPNMAWLAVIIGPLFLGGIIMKHFFAGLAFFSFSGPKAGSDDGFFGVVSLASAVEGAYSFWLSKRDHNKNSFVKT